MKLVTEFVTRHDDGPSVTARREGNTWSFTWIGRRERAVRVVCDHATAESIAEYVAKEAADIDPYRREVERREQDLAAWIQTQADEGAPK